MYKTALNILKILNNAGFNSYIIGGYSRCKYLNIKNADIDICTSATYDDLKLLFKKITYKNYDSMTLYFNNYKFDITTFRNERNYKQNGIPQYDITKNIIQDIYRRDFTINTLCIDKNGDYIDFIGAKNDLDLKIIKAVGNADKKIKEDAIRILRAIRIATELDFKINNDLEKAILKYGKSLTNLSKNKIKIELDKIFKSNNVMYGINLLNKFKLSEFLNLKTKKVIKTSYIGIWYQVLTDNKYNFNKKERNLLNKINFLMTSSKTNYDLYKCDLETIKIVDTLLNSNLIYRYKKLPIKHFEELNIDLNFLKKVDNISNVKKEIVKLVLNNKLSNNKNDINLYIKKYIHKS